MRRIAVPIDESGITDSHFGHCKYFALIDVDDHKISSEEILQAPPHEPGLLPKWLAVKGVTDVLAGGIGNRAIQNFNQHNINVFAGAPALPFKELVNGFLNDSITFSSNCCDH